MTDPERIIRANERRIHFRFFMDFMQLVMQSRVDADPPSIDRVLILSAIVLGCYERRPFRPQKLASYLGMPRTTLLRRLDDLKADGWIETDGKGYLYARPERLNDPHMVNISDKLSTLIHKAHHNLVELEQKENKNNHIGQ